ncbi:MAG: hypothetical protein L0H63_15300 [Nitrococcus sp.]|nr:hypothetical protein [Nitrococcus sp.]
MVNLEGKTILPNALPITVLRALWKRNSKGDLLIEIAEDRDLSYTDAWYLLQKVIRKTGSLNGPQGYVVKTLLRNKHTNVVEAVDGYEALVQAVGEKQLLEAARKVSAIPMDGKGNLTDLKPLGLVRYRDIWDSEKELPAGRSADGRIAVMWALPQTALAALWCKDNPQAYAVQLIVDGRHYGYAEAWGSYQAIAQVVGEEKLLAVAKEIYLAPKRSGGKWKQEFRKRRHMGLLVTPAPPGDEYYMYKPYWKLQTELIAGKDTRTQIRYFIALETHDAQSIDKTHESLVKLKGGKALLAAAERLRAAHWQTDARLPVIEALPRIMNGQSEPWVPRADGPHRPATP